VKEVGLEAGVKESSCSAMYKAILFDAGRAAHRAVLPVLRLLVDRLRSTEATRCTDQNEIWRGRIDLNWCTDMGLRSPNCKKIGISECYHLPRVVYFARLLRNFLSVFTDVRRLFIL